MILYFGSHAISDAIHTARYSAGSGDGGSGAGIAVGGGFSAESGGFRRCVRFADHTDRDPSRDTRCDTAPDTGVPTDPDLAISIDAGFAYPVSIEIAQEVISDP